jgi:type I restriction enzyme S subunit
MEKQLPKNWVECNLMDVSNVITGKKDANHSTEEGEYTFFTCAFEPIRSPDYDFEDEVLILPGNGANVGHVFYFNGKFQAYQRTYIVEKIKINPKYLFYHFLAFWRIRNENEQFGTATNYIKIGNFQSYNVDVAPLAEQNRIVEKLDRLFAQLETIKSSMANIPLLLKDFRQQVLSQAVTGKLTKNTINQVASFPSTITIGNVFTHTPDNWKWEKLIDIAKLESGHTPRKSEIEYWINGDIPWISLQDIRAAHGKIISETKYMPNELGIRKSSARLLPKGTVCFCRDISVGYTTVMGKEMSTTQHFANWICGKSLNNMFLLYTFMAAKDFLIASGKGTTVGTIYMPALKELRILLPPLEEQQKIVNRVESLFAKADAIEQQYKTLKASIDTLPQALLHKAFKGELSEQLESDGDARELLQQIMELKNSAVKPKKATAKKVKNYPENKEVLGMVAEK